MDRHIQPDRSQAAENARGDRSDVVIPTDSSSGRGLTRVELRRRAVTRPANLAGAGASTARPLAVM
jgi:hypothetical protein